MRILALAAALLVLALGSIWFFGSTGSPASPDAPEVEVRDTAWSGGAVDPGREDDAGSGRDGAPARSELSEELDGLSPAWDGPMLEVRVVQIEGEDADARKSVVGAELWWVLHSRIDWAGMSTERQRKLSQLSGKDMELWYRELGTKVVTDADGCCHVPIDENGVQMMARSGELYGAGYSQRVDESAFELVVRPDVTVRARLLDEQGQPISDAFLHLRRADQADPAVNLISKKTDAAGRCTIPHVQARVEERSGAVAGELCAWLPGGGGPKAALDLLAPPEEEIVLQLRESGTIIVRYLEADGTPVDPRFLEVSDVSVVGLEERPADPDRLGRQEYNRTWSATLDSDGVARVDHVVLDRFFIARHEYWTKLSFDGPTRQKPHVEVVLQRESDSVVLTGRLLDPDGTPVQENIRIAWDYEEGSGSAAGKCLEEGRFRCYTGAWMAGKIAKLTISRSDGVQARRDEFALVPERHYSPGVIDLGELQLGAVDPVIEGVFVCDPGLSPRVQLSVERRRGERWRQDWQHRMEIDGETFRIWGPAKKGEPVRLVWAGGKHLPLDPIECVAGTTGLKVHLRAGGSATASFLIDEQTPLAELVVKFEPKSKEARASRGPGFAMFGSRDGQSNLRHDPERENVATQTWTGLKPGSYTLRVQCGGIEKPIAVVEDVVVSVGACADPRLRDIDLRGLTGFTVVRLRTGDGAPVTHEDAWVVVASGDRHWRSYSAQKGQAFVPIVTGDTVEVWGVAPGFRIAKADLGDQALDLTLEPAREARVRLQLPATLPAGKTLKLICEPQPDESWRRLSVTRRGRSGPASRFFGESGVVAADGSVTLRPRLDTDYSFTLRLGRYNIWVTPRTAELTAGAEVVLTVDPKRYSEVLTKPR